ncbi:Carboxypeptidase regulatory-like domain-containing protein [Bryocella elongata]|uniref:Carboxypeptidase regulatory-like domain-containing protein n=1 Tax=Bryocella elongata TaxID=863522 RepID=A0A1H6AZ61_9BACT|nr:carboxypeptidase-like regulatory domain-containing protein [Bryocella elongata]SEG53317.1 Carboxypeptidase regulatory-like domain-containing protein [Bryocella elongata]
MFFCSVVLLQAGTVFGQQVEAPQPQTGKVAGVITDADGELIPGAKVVVTGPNAADRLTAESDGEGFFVVEGLKPLVAYQISIGETGFADWTSTVTLQQPGQYLYLKEVQLQVAAVVTAVTAATSEEIALQEVHAEEHQRVLGIVPNFMVVYDRNPQPLSARLKYQLAFRSATDAVTIAGSLFIAAIDQASDTPAYQQGLKGYGQRFGAQYAGAFSDVMIGGAVLPSLLHQDPRYFYQGTGTRRSRIRHAMLAPFLCPGDNGKTQFNYSSVGGDLGAAALENLYYPQSNRGVGLVFSTAAITTAGRIASTLAQEFLLRRLTAGASKP